jgi:hypothetical protein
MTIRSDGHGEPTIIANVTTAIFSFEELVSYTFKVNSV